MRLFLTSSVLGTEASDVTSPPGSETRYRTATEGSGPACASGGPATASTPAATSWKDVPLAGWRLSVASVLTPEVDCGSSKSTTFVEGGGAYVKGRGAT